MSIGVEPVFWVRLKPYKGLHALQDNRKRAVYQGGQRVDGGTISFSWNQDRNVFVEGVTNTYSQPRSSIGCQ